jgi:uncharacterized protein YndB with AHSA1/START domain
MTHATLVTEGTRPAVRLERRLADPPEVVWRALTDRDELRAWFPCDVIVDGGAWNTGAAITFVFPPDVIDLTIKGEVIEVDEPHVLEYTWGDDRLRFELTARDGGTELVLFDELPASWAARNAAGWQDCLDRLSGATNPSGDWKTRFDAYAAEFTPRIGAQEGPPAEVSGN